MVNGCRRHRIDWRCIGLAIALIGCAKRREQAPPPPVVSVTEVTQKDVTVYREFAGTLDANVRAEVRARVAGTLLEQNYREGSFVKAGALLFTIDPEPLRAAQLQAEGQLGQARAALEKAEADVARYTPLVAKRAASKEQLDNAIAAVHAGKGQVELAQGQLKQANINLGYTRVVAPIDGIADIAQIRIGNLVGQASPTLLTTVSNINPIRFVFQISEAKYLEYAERIRLLSERPISDLAQPSDDPAQRLDLVLAGDQHYPYRGYIAIVSSQVDPSTGTVTIQALFPNPDMLLRPGQYARVRFTDKLPNAVLVPERSVSQVQGQNQVAVIGPKNIVEVRNVKLGPTSGSFVVAENGVKAGERVVLEGTQKVKAGAPITPAAADTSTLQLSSAAVELQNPLTPTATGAAGDAAATPAAADAGPPPKPTDAGPPRSPANTPGR
ncbi:RND efflux system, membrane fusion protein CmeA [Labilithrix luteola]|uniref:RND efflux system, membrane fusion protein CmeA n=1 Tax=Labilithrix luteola TaxID=1391654 RepID=A0A0K1QGB5_9BACT|nr:efflux RND transporter periplasmic adaptor subunit [Labilithrix luteola]AKV04806.1 RND efflux system, membrane fusion protein CmeA [Labilithrix luteola]